MDDIEEIRRHKADMLQPQLIASNKELQVGICANDECTLLMLMTRNSFFLQLEVIQRRHQVENLEKDQEEKDGTYEMVMHEVERLELDRERHAAAFSQANEMPQKIMYVLPVLDRTLKNT